MLKIRDQAHALEVLTNMTPANKKLLMKMIKAEFPEARGLDVHDLVASLTVAKAA